MKEHYVSYEQAVALKRLGFAEKVNRGYSRKIRIEPELSYGDVKEVHSKDPKNYNDNRKGAEKGLFFYSAPRLDQAAAWLRNCKGIDVLVFNSACGYGWEISKADPQSRGTMIAFFDDNGEDEPSGMWWTYESALSAGISATLELLGKEVKE